MKSALVGKFFHSFKDEERTVEWQGKVVAQIEPSVYLVETYSWIGGDVYTTELVRLESMFGWCFYDSLREMKEALKHKWSGGKDINSRHVQLDSLEAFLHNQADNGKPLTASGSTGVWENRHILPPSLGCLSKAKLACLVKELLESGRIVKAHGKGERDRKWLCSSGDSFSCGKISILPGDY